MKNISWVIPRKNIWNELTSNADRLAKSTMIIAENQFDDADSKWWINAYKNSDDDDIIISLETEYDIIDSASCNSQESVEEIINSFLEIEID